jgi:hypothetical protein
LRLVGVNVATTVRSESTSTVHGPVPGHSNTLQPTKPVPCGVSVRSCPSVTVYEHGRPLSRVSPTSQVVRPETATAPSLPVRMSSSVASAAAPLGARTRASATVATPAQSANANATASVRAGTTDGRVRLPWRLSYRSRMAPVGGAVNRSRRTRRPHVHGRRASGAEPPNRRAGRAAGTPRTRTTSCGPRRRRRQ